LGVYQKKHTVPRWPTHRAAMTNLACCDGQRTVPRFEASPEARYFHLNKSTGKNTDNHSISRI